MLNSMKIAIFAIAAFAGFAASTPAAAQIMGGSSSESSSSSSRSGIDAYGDVVERIDDNRSDNQLRNNTVGQLLGGAINIGSILVQGGQQRKGIRTWGEETRAIDTNRGRVTMAVADNNLKNQEEFLVFQKDLQSGGRGTGSSVGSSGGSCPRGDVPQKTADGKEYCLR